MVKKNQFKITDIISVIFISFILMSTIYLFASDKISFYHIIDIDFHLLIQQGIVFFSLFAIIILIHYFYRPIHYLPLISLTYLVYILVFMIQSPAFSLRVGALITLIPFIYINVKEMFNRNKNFFNLFTLNNLLLLVIIIYFIFTIGDSSILENIINTSQISNDPIIADDYKEYVIYSIPIFIALIAIFFFNRFKRVSKNRLPEIIFIIGLTLFEVISLSLIMIFRTKTLLTSTYDFGIYAQMFYNMKNFNGMMTTLERSVLLSHNAVHFSPIYYLMLPVYMLYPTLETLQVLQVVIVAIGVIPIYLIANHFKLNRTVVLIIITMYLFNPAIISSSFYDLHENSFLPPLLLFSVYFGLKHQWVGLIISAILTLLIKEDAGIYLIFIGLFFLFSNDFSTKKEKIKHMVMSAALIIVPLIYFYFVTKMINTDGDGAMFWRYSNLEAYDDLGIFGLPLTLFQNLSYWLATMFTPSKIYHILIIFLCLGFIPLLNKKFSHYWLIIPLLIMNFSSTYPYQSLFGFQYYYGTTTLLVVMVLLSFKENQKPVSSHIRPVIGHILVVIPIVFLIILGVNVFQSKSYYKEYYDNHPEMYDSMRQTLADIPEESKVIATGYLTPYLSNREVLYDIEYYSLITSEITFDYIILDNRLRAEELAEFQFTVEMLGYVESDSTDEFLIIYVPAT